MKAFIKALEHALPAGILDNDELARVFPEWPAHKIRAKTGINARHIATEGECASDLAFAAATKLFDTTGVTRESIDFIVLCTQSPDYLLPTTACLLQNRLGLREHCGAFDMNLGCSGYIYGLGLAKGLIETAQVRNILFLTADTYSKYIHPNDRSVRTLFGDAATATLISSRESASDLIGPFVYGTDGSGAGNLIVPAGGTRNPKRSSPEVTFDGNGNCRTENNLYMDGPEIFNFTLKVVPPLIARLLHSAQLDRRQVDMWVFHQANEFMLEHLRNKLGIPVDRFAIALSECGNTVSSTIPIALRELDACGRLQPGQCVALVGFGVGYSWGATIVRWGR
jgi:3-oxoacyl-[acyl-carrier-protein] synthase-3